MFFVMYNKGMNLIKRRQSEIDKLKPELEQEISMYVQVKN